MRLHCGIIVVIVMGGQPPAAAEPADPPAFKHTRVADAWEAYRGKLSFGKGQTLALVDESLISIRNPHALAQSIRAERISLGIAGDYKPSLALIPGSSP